jgi:ABC-type transport system substrate-binding protein
MSTWPREGLETAVSRYPDDFITAPRMALSWLILDPGSAPFDDVRVRKALVKAIDRDKLALDMWGHNAQPAHGGLVPPAMPGHSPGIGLAHDPEEARELIAAAGYANGVGFPALEPIPVATTCYFGQAFFKALMDSWREVLNISLEFDVTGPDQPAWGKLLARGKYVASVAWTADYPDPHNLLHDALMPDRLCHSTVWPAYLQLLEQARLAYDQDQRLEHYKEMDRLLVENALIVPMSYDRWLLLAKPWAKKHPLSPLAEGCRWKDSILLPH